MVTLLVDNAILPLDPEGKIFTGIFANLDKDYIGPRIYGFESILYDKNDREHKSLKKIKKLKDIIRIYEK